ncbi:hypothetical protein BJ165DRAFT_1404837 [Panaeolus papilionaceus]|nr:hypothetical protein BJ165DRAFT_1404837 [Panaeolus papilionaceus]
MACTYPATYTTADISSPPSFGAGRSSSSGRRSSRSSSTSSRRSSSSSSSRVSSRDSSPNPLDAQIRKSRATCTLSLTHVYVPGSSSASSGVAATATAMMMGEGAVAALSDTRLPRVDDGGDLHVDVMIEQIRTGGMENGVGVGVDEMTTEEQEQVVPEFTAALKSSTSGGKSRSVPSSSSLPSRATGSSSINQIPFPTSTSTSIVNATTATRATTPSTASTNAATAGSSPAAHILLRTTTLPPSSVMTMQRPAMSIRVAPLATRTGSTPATSKPADAAPPARRSRKSSVSLHGVPIASKARVSSRTGKSIPIPVPMPRRKVATALGDHILDEDSPKVKEREAERLAVSSVTTTNARGESSSPPPYSPEPPPYEAGAAAVAAAAAAAAGEAQVQEGDGLKPTLHQPQPIRAKSYVDLSLLKPSLVAQLSKSQSKSKSASSTTPKSSSSTSPPPRRRVSSSDVRILLHLYRTLTVGLEKRHRAYEAAKAAERLEEAARIARKKLEGQWRFPIVEEDVDGEDVEVEMGKVGCESVLDEDEEERILVPATPPPTRNSSRSSTPTLVAASPSPEPYHYKDEKRHTAKFKPEFEVQDAILSIRLRNFLKAQGVSERDLEVRFSDEGDVVGAPEEVVVEEESEEDDGGSVTYDLLQEDDEDENGDSAPAETPAAPASAPLPTTPPPPSPPPKPSASAPFIMPQTNMIALLTMRHRYTGQRGRRSSKDDYERDAQGKKKRKTSGLGAVVASAGADGRGFEGVVVECVDEDAEEQVQKQEEQEEDEEEIVVARG